MHEVFPTHGCFFILCYISHHTKNQCGSNQKICQNRICGVLTICSFSYIIHITVNHQIQDTGPGKIQKRIIEKGFSQMSADKRNARSCNPAARTFPSGYLLKYAGYCQTCQPDKYCI